MVAKIERRWGPGASRRQAPLPAAAKPSLTPRSASGHLDPLFPTKHATHIPPPSQKARPPPRFPRAHGHQERSQSARGPPAQGPQTPDRGLSRAGPATAPGRATVRPAPSRLELPPLHLHAQQRLRRQNDFRLVREQGRRVDRGVFTLWWRRRDPDAGVTPAALVRVGVVASIAAVGPAVRRNAAKRRLRELFRRHQQLVPPGTDLLLVARAALNRLDFREAEARFVAACGQIGDHPA